MIGLCNECYYLKELNEQGNCEECQKVIEVDNEKEEKKMRYFEVCDPYYALVKAETKDKAMEIYTRLVADDDGTLVDEMKEVDKEYALVKFSRGLTEDRRELPISEVIDEWNCPNNELLLIDGSLL